MSSPSGSPGKGLEALSGVLYFDRFVLIFVETSEWHP